jgi:hypothetical protein
MTEPRFPAVDRLRAQLRSDLMRAARANPHARSRRRRRLLVVAVAAVVATPASLAAAGVFDSPEVAYECPEAQQLNSRDTVTGAPAEGPGQPAQVAPEPERPAPENPCD